MVVKLAASMPVCLRATLQSSELPAKASMASDVRAMTRADDMEFYFPRPEIESVQQAAERKGRDLILCSEVLIIVREVIGKSNNRYVNLLNRADIFRAESAQALVLLDLGGYTGGRPGG